jgi:hypothetical protein
VMVAVGIQAVAVFLTAAPYRPKNKPQ